MEHVTAEFREIYDTINGVKPYSGLKVAVLNAWGKLRTWQNFIVAHGKWYRQAYSYHGILEALSGMAVDVTFLSFDDIAKDGVPADIDVIINAGDADTAFSGGDHWKNEKVLTAIRSWVDQGGGFVGVGEPTAVHREGRYFQLANVLGVDKELGFSLSTNKYFTERVDSHFITADQTADYDFGEGMKYVYALDEQTEIIAYSEDSVQLSSSPFGKGRGVYIAGLPFSHDNARLLQRALFYAANKESELEKWFASNVHCEVHAYPSIGKYAVLNNADTEQKTTVFDGKGNSYELTLQPGEITWKEDGHEG